MSFSLPLQALGTFQLMIRIPGNGAPMRPSFELKSLPVAELLKQAGCDAPTLSSIHFEVVEDVDGLGLMLVVSKDPEQIRWRSLPGTPSSQDQAFPNYLETDDQKSGQESPMGPENSILQNDISGAGNFDMASFMLPAPPGELMPGTMTDMSFFGTPHLPSFTEMPRQSRSVDVYASSLGTPRSPVSMRPADAIVTASPCASSCSSSPPAPSGVSPASCQDAEVETDDMSASTRSSSSTGPRRRPRNFPCQKPNCNRVFTSSYTRDAHMLTHRPKTKKSYECTLGCGAYFSRQHDRWRHEVTQHGKPSQWVCTRCSQYFLSQRGLETHKNMCSVPLVLGERNEIGDA